MMCLFPGHTYFVNLKVDNEKDHNLVLYAEGINTCIHWK